MPSPWQRHGFKWELSFQEWLDLLEKLGFSVAVTREPTTEEFQGRDCFSAEITTKSTSEPVEVKFNFNYGDGKTRHALHTLYSINVRYVP